MAIPIQLRRGTAATWTSVNPILAQGEAGFETDTNKIKMGNGSSVWTALAYTIDSSGSVSDVTYNASTWDGVTAIAPSKNAVRDKIEALDAAKQPLSTVLTNTTASFTTASESKLAGVAAGATANSSDATLLARSNHTGTQSADTLTDGTTNKAFLATERTKLASLTVGLGTTGDAYATSHESDTTAHPASSIVNTPAGNISATTVQGAINELDSEKVPPPLSLTAVPANGIPAVAATSMVSFSAIPDIGSHLVVNGRSYTYRAAGSSLTGDEISRGYTTASEAAINTANQINGGPDGYVTAAYSGAGISAGQVRLTAKVAGVSGNSLTIADDAAQIYPNPFTGGVDIIPGTVGKLGQSAIVSHSDGTKTEWGCVDDYIIMRWAPRTAGIFMNRTTGLYERTFISNGTIQTENLPNQ